MYMKCLRLSPIVPLVALLFSGISPYTGRLVCRLIGHIFHQLNFIDIDLDYFYTCKK